MQQILPHHCDFEATDGIEAIWYLCQDMGFWRRSQESGVRSCGVREYRIGEKGRKMPHLSISLSLNYANK